LRASRRMAASTVEHFHATGCVAILRDAVLGTAPQDEVVKRFTHSQDEVVKNFTGSQNDAVLGWLRPPVFPGAAKHRTRTPEQAGFRPATGPGMTLEYSAEGPMGKDHPSKDGESAAPAPAAVRGADEQAPARRHPLFGALKGLLRVMPGTDLTEPADPTWEHCDPK